jgi:hypothetical protein
MVTQILALVAFKVLSMRIGSEATEVECEIYSANKG